MRLVVDANALFSSLIRDGLTRRVWFDPQVILFAPAHLLVEFSKYRDYLLAKYRGLPKDFDRLLEKTLRQVEFLPDEELLPYFQAAAVLVPDPKDWPYVACALKENTAIWTHDPHFFGQRRIKVYSTKELADELGLL